MSRSRDFDAVHIEICRHFTQISAENIQSSLRNLYLINVWNINCEKFKFKSQIGESVACSEASEQYLGYCLIANDDD